MAKKIKPQDLIAKFQTAANEGWGYIWGGKGQIWTQKMQDAVKDDMAQQYGSKWIGKRVADCSGLFYWAFNVLGGSIAHGSNSIWNKYCSAKGTITKSTVLKPGTAVFKLRNETDYYHIGLYIGDNKVIEAKSTIKGVVITKLSDWSHWGQLSGVQYDISNEPVKSQTVVKPTTEYPTLHNKDVGDFVKVLQELLNKHLGTTLVPDGEFGPKTLAAVKKFQTKKKLKVDGVVGAKTWAALLG